VFQSIEPALARLAVSQVSSPSVRATPPNEADRQVSSVALRLFAALERHGIRHCHWKSNVRLDRTLCGLEDIDVLVHPADADEFQRVINECGFKLTVSRIGAGHPGVLHALAWDAEIGRLLDLHAYHQLISGDSFVKSFRFRVEDELLLRTTRLMDVRIPDPSSELVLFLLRILLKHVSFIEIAKVHSHYEECIDELAWLEKRSDAVEAAALCQKWFPAIRIPLQQMIDCVRSGSPVERTIMGMRIAWALRRERRIGHVAATCSRALRVGKHYAVRLRGRRNLTLLSGGAWVALVGPKGTGKSTLVRLLEKRLGKNLDVKTIHLGKPPATWVSFLPRLMLPLLRKLRPGERLREYEKPERREQRNYSTLFVLGKLLVALDRRSLLTRTMRATASGTIVISDRCPATNSTGLDGSAFDDLAVARQRSPLKRRLMEWERSIYRGLPAPRLVLKLNAPIETALQRDLTRRKAGGPDPMAIQRRWALESGAQYSRSSVCSIDTEKGLEETLRTAMACVWRSV
jgi:thymidylate kinase